MTVTAVILLVAFVMFGLGLLKKGGVFLFLSVPLFAYTGAVGFAVSEPYLPYLSWGFAILAIVLEIIYLFVEM